MKHPLTVLEQHLGARAAVAVWFGTSLGLWALTSWLGIDVDETLQHAVAGLVVVVVAVLVYEGLE